MKIGIKIENETVNTNKMRKNAGSRPKLGKNLELKSVWEILTHPVEKKAEEKQ
jgi:hypothetical protein